MGCISQSELRSGLTKTLLLKGTCLPAYRIHFFLEMTLYIHNSYLNECIKSALFFSDAYTLFSAPVYTMTPKEWGERRPRSVNKKPYFSVKFINLKWDVFLNQNCALDLQSFSLQCSCVLPWFLHSNVRYTSALKEKTDARSAYAIWRRARDKLKC